MSLIYSHHELNQNKKWNKRKTRQRKIRQRYIGFRILAPDRRFSWGVVNREIWRVAKKIYPKEDLRLKLMRFNGKEGILRCSHLYKEETIHLLRSIDKLGDERVKIETVGTSGTIKALIRKFFRDVELKYHR